jgi:site-specific recombinase XerD
MAQQVDLFRDSLKSEHTKDQYEIHLKRYQEKAPTTEKDPEALENHIAAYLGDMKQEGLSYSYRNTALSAIKHYYTTMFRSIRLNWEFISKFLGEETISNELRGYTREEIKKLLEVSDLRDSAIILTLGSSAIRREALINIKIKDMHYLENCKFKDGEKTFYYNLYKFKIYIGSKSKQICFTTPEAATAINLYLEDRKRKGITSDKLFIFEQPHSISVLLRQIAIRAGVSAETKHISNEKGNKLGQFRSEIPAVHGLRKYAISAMKKAHVDTETRKMLSGHSIGVQEEYLDGYTEDDLLQEYLKAIPLLSINQEAKLQIQVNDLLAEKDNEIAQLKKEVEQLKKTRQQIADEVQDKIINIMKDPNGPFKEMEDLLRENGRLEERLKQQKEDETAKA